MLYRTDIDGLRAFAVISVVLFHLGFLPNGYLGVDIFFVISGYLITSIIYNKSEKNQFSLWEFYQRRIRRIIPLLLFTTTLALIIGIFLMLPDDLDNLAQSVFASNFSANNILMYITSSDYWSVKNEYKPLMHTWSLGIEEQFYLIYPMIFLLFQGDKSKYIKVSLVILTIASFSFFLISESAAEKFYLLHHRFFELTVGGIGAVYFKTRIFNNSKSINSLLIFSALLGFITIVSPVPEYNSIKVIAISLSTVAILIIGKGSGSIKTWYNLIFENKVAVTIGKISFSLYMMHQLIFAFSRYAYLEEITPIWAVILVGFTIAISFITYHFIENPFRNHQLFSTKKVLTVLIPVFIISSTAALYIYMVGGIIKDYPELNVYKEDQKIERKLFKITTNIHIQYNEDVRLLDKDFEESDKLKILVIGNSFGRDITNIILESEVFNDTQIRYYDIFKNIEDQSFQQRIKKADRIIFAGYGIINYDFLREIESQHNLTIDKESVWVFSTKSYGIHNGIHYNAINSKTDFNSYRTSINMEILYKNEKMNELWQHRFIDLMSPIVNEDNQVLVFTPNGKFISPDTAHLTEEGAKFYADILKEELRNILSF